MKQGKRQRQKVRTRVLLAAVMITGSIFLVTSMLVFMNMNNLSKSKASGTGNEGGGNDLNSGEIVSEFTWEQNSPNESSLGPDAIRANEDAHCMPGGRANSKGLSPGPKGKGIDMHISGDEIFKIDGIDISIDFKRNEPDGDFFTWGSAFNFGMTNGLLTVYYALNKMGRQTTIKEKTNFEVPEDNTFRNYRFMFTPATGKAEIFVNNIIVWQKQHEKNSALTWNTQDDIIIGRNMDGGGKDMAILDNLTIRSTGSAMPLAESLLNFMLEAKDGGVQIQWSTSVNDDVDHFTIEKSLNGREFESIANIASQSDSIDEYTFFDKSAPTSSMVYYRLRQNFRNGKYVSHTLSALKLKGEKKFSIETVAPSPFKRSCDISYFLPRTGRVWIQMTDEKGKIINTETFEAPQGKNVHVFTDEKDIPSGNYTFSVIFDNKKVSKKVVKW